MAVVKISEINLLKDYVALRNNNSVKINLRGWKIIDTTPTNQKRHEYIFPKDFFLQPDASVKIWSDVGNNDASNVYQNRRAKIWNNPGDTATLYDLNGNKIDELTVGNPPKGGRGGGAKPPVPPKPPTPAKITISGFVNDVVCKQPIQNAKLVFQVLKGQKEAETNTAKNGYYETELTGGRDYTVTISEKNYDDLPDTINTKVGKDMTKNFKLEPNLEIELDVDSAEVKFTKKDDNKINATQELKGKIVVDFNTNYTFSVKVLIKKGMTNNIQATILEKETSTNRNAVPDNVCRINKEDKTVIITFNPIKQKWDWVVLGAFWYVNNKETKKLLEKTYNYLLNLQGNYGNNKFNLNPPFELGKIVVRVNGEKLKYLAQYTLFLTEMYKAMTVAAVLGVAAAFQPWLAPVAIAAGAAATFLGMQKDSALASAKDPPQFDKNYKKLVKPKINLKIKNIKQTIKQLKLLRESIIVSRDRAYSAYIKQNNELANQHVKNTEKLLHAHGVTSKFILRQLKKSVKTLKKYKTHFNTAAISQFRKSVRSKVLPRMFVLNSLQRARIPEKDARMAIRVMMHKKISDSALTLVPVLGKVTGRVDKFNKLFVQNMRKEIKWYKTHKI